MSALIKTSRLLVPTPTATATATASATPTALPTVLPGPLYENVGDAGKKTLWVVFVLMLLSSLTFTAMAWRVPVQKRLFHVLTAFITVFATLSYFAMAVGDGNTYTDHIIKHSSKHVLDEHVLRQIFWARYVDWAVTTPLLLLDLAFLAGMSGADILVAIVADVIMVLLGLFGALGVTRTQRWGYFVMACLAYLVIVYQLVVSGRKSAMAKSGSTAKLFASIGGFTLILWTLYPIVWGLGDGSRTWGVDTELIAYAVLDVLAKPVFGFWLLFAHARNVKSIEGFWSNGLSSEGGLHIGDED